MDEDKGSAQAKQDLSADSRLDFTSPDFDAAAALQDPGLQPPIPDAPVLDNVSKCSTLLPWDPAPAEAKQAQGSSEAMAKKAKAAGLKQRAHAAAQRAEASVALGSLASIMSKAAVGPLAVLARWQASGQRVLVITRHAAGVRGRAVGTLKGFDKFMNLLLADVEETYTVIVKVPRVKHQLSGATQAAAAPRDNSGSSRQGAPSQETSVAGPNGGSRTSAAEQQQRQQQGQQQQGQQQAQHRQLQIAEQHQQGHAAMELQLELQQPQRQLGEGAAGRSRVRWCRKQEQRFRRLDQVLLVGDNVVLISSVPPLVPQLGVTT